MNLSEYIIRCDIYVGFLKLYTPMYRNYLVSVLQNTSPPKETFSMCTARIKCTAHFKDGKTWTSPLQKIQSSLYVKQIAAASDDQQFVSGNRLVIRWRRIISHFISSNWISVYREIVLYGRILIFGDGYLYYACR